MAKTYVDGFVSVFLERADTVTHKYLPVTYQWYKDERWSPFIFLSCLSTLTHGKKRTKDITERPFLVHA